MNHNLIDKEPQLKSPPFNWRFTAILFSVATVAMMLISISFIKEKITANFPSNSSFRASDLMWKIAMPALDAALK